jgi:hypothetical protein
MAAQHDMQHTTQIRALSFGVSAIYSEEINGITSQYRADDSFMIAPFVPVRTPWGEFPDVIILAAESATKRHPDLCGGQGG